MLIYIAILPQSQLCLLFFIIIFFRIITLLVKLYVPAVSYGPLSSHTVNKEELSRGLEFQMQLKHRAPVVAAVFVILLRKHLLLRRRPGT